MDKAKKISCKKLKLLFLIQFKVKKILKHTWITQKTEKNIQKKGQKKNVIYIVKH